MQIAPLASDGGSGSPLLTVSEAARYLALSEATLNKWRSSSTNAIPYFKMSTRIAYRREDLDAFLAARRRNSTAPIGSDDQR